VAESTAWILDVGNSVRIAIGELEMVHLEQNPELFVIPKTPDFCQHTFIWQNTIIPVIDLGVSFQGQSSLSELSYIAIIRYRPAKKGDKELVQAAILLTEMPIRINIDDSFACSLPEKFQTLKTLIVSCFTFEDKSIPVLDLASVFSRSAQSILGSKTK